MPEELTRSQLDAMPTPKLVELYNRLTGAQLRRFQSRKIGIERIVVELNRQRPAEVQATRTVSPLATTDAKRGRPRKDFAVQISALGQSTVRSSSMRGKILAWLKEHDSKGTTQQLTEAFGEKARGAINKLLEVGWLKREQTA